MAHGREQIRNAVAVALGAVTSGTVYMERANRLEPSDLPGILVYMGDDTQQAGERAMGSMYDVEVDQTILVELHAAGATGVDVALAIDAMDEDVEQLLAGDSALNGLLDILVRESSTMTMSTEQDRVIALRAVTYVATWRHVFGAPETPEG